MESKAKLAGHPIHPILIVFPLGLLATAVIFDVIHLVSGDPRWSLAAFLMIGAGVIGGVAAAIPGTLDWLAIPRGTRAWRIGLIHGLGNVAVLILFTLSWLLRQGQPQTPPTGAVVAGLIGAGLAMVTGWLGGELVNRLGVGVDDGAHLDAPSSLTQLPAAAESGRATRSGMSHGYSGPERRRFPQPAYAGVDRRGRAG